MRVIFLIAICLTRLDFLPSVFFWAKFSLQTLNGKILFTPSDHRVTVVLKHIQTAIFYNFYSTQCELYSQFEAEIISMLCCLLCSELASESNFKMDDWRLGEFNLF